MPYTKTTWTDEVLTEDARYDILEDDGTPISEDVQINLATDVSVTGTAVEADVMNNLEDGVEAAYNASLLSDNANTETLTGNLVLEDSDLPIQFLDAGGSARDITLPAEAATNHEFVIANTGGETLTVYDDTSIEIGSVAAGEMKMFVSDGTSWMMMSGGGLPEPGTSGNVLTSNGTNWESAAPTGGGGISYLCQGRLTLESGVPVSITDQVDKTTLYFTPFKGNLIDLYTDSVWTQYEFTEKSLALGALTASKPHDIVIYDNAGTLTLQAVEWTNATTRATALTTQDGVYVLTGATNKRYLGTIYIDSGQKCQDTVAKRYVWNLYNQVHRPMKVVDTTDTWTYSTATWRSWNNSAANRIEFVTGISLNPIQAVFSALGKNDGGYTFGLGIGLDATNANNATSYISGASTGYLPGQAVYHGYPGIGYHYLQAVEMGNSSGTTTFAGDANVAWLQSGMTARIVG